jgi:integrase
MQKVVQHQQYYNRFIDSLSRSPETQKKYIKEFNYYLKYLKVNDANALITADLIDLPAAIRQAEDRIIEYLKYLTNNEKLSHSSVSVRLAAILYFYTINRVNINRKYICRFKPANKKLRKDKAYTHEQILHLLNSNTADLRSKTIILLLSSTGMRVGALHALTIGSLHKVQVYPDSDTHIYKIIVYEQEPEEYYTFCTFECAQVIDRYLEFRRQSGEDISSIKAPLIREEFDHTDKLKARIPKRLSNDSFSTIIDRMLTVSGLRYRTNHKDRHLHDVMASHGFRKFAITQMKKAQLDFSDREFLVGHKVSRGLDVNYDRTSEEDRIQEYLKAMDLLTISPENRLKKEVHDKDQIIKLKLVEKDEALVALSDQVMKLMEEVQELKKQSRS